MIDVLLLAIVAAVTYLVASEGPWGAAITFVSVLLSGLFAMNFFEPLAMFLSTNVMNSFTWQHYWDVIALLGLFAAGVFGLRAIGEKLFPTFAEVNPAIHELGRWGLGAITGYTTMAILLTALHTAPLPREFLGFQPERNNFFQVAAPDRQWLALTQYVSEKSLRKLDAIGNPTVFDGPQYPRIPGDPSTTLTWSSFPIKYAARREQFASEGASSSSGGSSFAPPPPGAAPPADASPTQPAPQSQPQGGNRPSGAGSSF